MRQRRRGDRTGPPPADPQSSRRGDPAAPGRRPEPLVGPAHKQARARAARAAAIAASEGPVITKRSDAARNPLVVALNFVFLLAMFALVGGVAALIIGRDAFYAPGPLEETVQVNIPRGASLMAIADGLEQQDIISSQYVFAAAARAGRASRDIKAGEYVIPARASMADVLARIVSGDVVHHRVTLAEGLTSAQMVRLVNNSALLSGTISTIPPEGTLLPETYSVTRGTPRDQVLARMRSAQEEVLAEIWANRDPDLPLETPQDLVTLASIVEKETGIDGERGEVAAVFVNRLNQGMKLQSDPTILYGLYGGAAWVEARTIFKSDFNRPNAYNTYQIDGLPPGPIANPGRAALEAVANPPQSDNLFFVADGTGGHVFSQTYEEHQRNVARWREIERQRQNGEGASQ
ncbi:MAG: endolytic transglycosylase MltG [Acuticoccus sp.]